MLLLQTVLQHMANVLMMFLFVRAVLLRQLVKSSYWVLLSVSILFYTVGYTIELDMHMLETGFIALRVQLMGGAFISMLTYLFLRDYNNRPLKSRLAVAGLLLIPALCLLSINMFPNSTLFIKTLQFHLEPRPHMLINRGALYHVYMLYNLCMIILCVVEVLRHYPWRKKSERLLKVLFVACTMAPFLPVVASYYWPSRMHVQLAPSAIMLTYALVHYYITKRRVQDWLPFARDRVIEQIGDGFVLIDTNNCFVDANTVAKQLYPALEQTQPGTPVSAIADFPHHALQSETAFLDFSHRVNENEIVLRSHKSIIQYEEKPVCTFMNFYDVTEIHKLMKELEIRASYDSLTGLRNRGSFFELATRDFALHMRTKSPAVCMLLDLDHFKKVNDTYGHQAGDEVLRSAAAIVKGRTRHTDICGRYGGEEICLFLPDTDLSQAYVVATSIREAMACKQFFSDGRCFEVTISAGLALLCIQRHTSLESLIADADIALYNAKHHGRNRVECYWEESA